MGARRGDVPRPPGAAAGRENPEHLAMLETWMRSYRPDKLFDAGGRVRAELAALAPTGDATDGRSPHANGGRRLVPLSLPEFRATTRYRWPATARSATNRLAASAGAARRLRAQRGGRQLSGLLSRRDELESARCGVRGREPLLRRAAIPIDDHVAGRTGDGGAQRAQLPGLARGLPADRAARPVRHLRGVRDGGRRRWWCSTRSGSNRPAGWRGGRRSRR